MVDRKRQKRIHGTLQANGRYVILKREEKEVKSLKMTVADSSTIYLFSAPCRGMWATGVCAYMVFFQ